MRASVMARGTRAWTSALLSMAVITSAASLRDSRPEESESAVTSSARLSTSRSVDHRFALSQAMTGGTRLGSGPNGRHSVRRRLIVGDVHGRHDEGGPSWKPLMITIITRRKSRFLSGTAKGQSES